jgi:putative DNA primase/helicase
VFQQGGNGKGLFNELVLKTFGQYAKTMTSAFFTEKSRNSGNATPQLADKKGIRVLIATEPEENEKLQVGRLKQISGNDQVQARDLFQSLFYFTPQFGIFFQCNTIPELSKSSEGHRLPFRFRPESNDASPKISR